MTTHTKNRTKNRCKTWYFRGGQRFTERLYTGRVTGRDDSHLPNIHTNFGRVAQLVEQVTFNHWVTGSNPVALTISSRCDQTGYGGFLASCQRVGRARIAICRQRLPPSFYGDANADLTTISPCVPSGPRTAKTLRTGSMTGLSPAGWHGRPIPTVRVAPTSFRAGMSMWISRRPRDPARGFALALCQYDRVIGGLVCNPVDDQGDREIGFWLARSFWG